MPKIIFARIAWHPRYDGQYPPPYTGANWKEKKGGGFGEWQNFCEFDKKYYGWAKPSNSWKADLTNLGAKSTAKYVNDITVIWIAPDPNGGSKIVGWYKNAAMYAELQNRPKPLKDHYLFKADISNCVILDESQRTFEIKKKFRNIWYAKGEIQFKKEVFAYIEGEYIDKFDDPAETYFSDIEGKKRLRNHLTTERSSTLVKEFKKSLSTYECSICGFDFEKTYGDIGKRFIEAHHIKVVSSLNTNEQVSIKDLQAVCSNCHRMLHRRVPPYTAKELSLGLKKKRTD